MLAALSRMSKPSGFCWLSVDSSARNVDTETTTGSPLVTVTVVFASVALVPTLVVSVKVNVVVAENVFGVKTSASSSLVIAESVPERR